MISLIAAVQSIAAQPEQATTPLQVQEDALVNSVSDVRWEFARQVFSNFSISMAAFRHLPVDNQKAIVRRGYYVQAITLSLLLPIHDPDLITIIKRVNQEDDVKSIVLDFEKTYHTKYHAWPPIIPVDVDALTARMMNDKVIR